MQKGEISLGSPIAASLSAHIQVLFKMDAGGNGQQISLRDFNECEGLELASFDEDKVVLLH